MVTNQWRMSVLSSGARICDAIATLDHSGLQIVMMVGQADELLGTITDGDIRRGLLRGLDLQEPAQTIMHREPLFVPPDLGKDAVIQLMHANKVRQLPIVDAARRVVGLHLWDELQSAAPAVRSNSLVIMAGGKGVRLRPHTENCPKPMLSVGGKPLLEHIIDRASSERFKHIIIATHYLGDMIEEYFGDGARWNVRIDYVREHQPLGTGGALSLLAPRPEFPILVTNGDVLTDVRYGEILDFHLLHQASATMAVRPYEWQHPFGVVRIAGMDVVGFEEKPVYRSHVNAGIYVINPTALSMLEPGERCDMPTLFDRLSNRGERTIAFPMHESWLDVGRPADLEQARRAFT